MKTNIKKAKVWIKEHKDELATAGFITGVVALYVSVGVVAIKVYNAQLEEEAANRNELAAAASRGASILPGPDGHYWILENQK